MKIGTVVMLTLFIFASPCVLEAQQVYIGGVTIRLGQPVDEVTTDLRKFFRLQPLPEEPETWMIRSKSGPPFETLGIVTTKNGRVINVSKSWTTANVASAGEFARLVVASLQSVTDSSGSSCTVTPSDSTQPTSDYRIVKITCGTRVLSISYVEHREGELAGKYASITEMISVR